MRFATSSDLQIVGGAERPLFVLQVAKRVIIGQSSEKEGLSLEGSTAIQKCLEKMIDLTDSWLVRQTLYGQSLKEGSATKNCQRQKGVELYPIKRYDREKTGQLRQAVEVAVEDNQFRQLGKTAGECLPWTPHSVLRLSHNFSK